MTDVTCMSCGEYWDSYHMWWDEIWETDLDDNLKEEGCYGRNFTKEKRKALEAIGWSFGKTVLAIRKCPCCCEEDTTNEERSLQIEVLKDLLGDDEDGLANMIEDMDLGVY